MIILFDFIAEAEAQDCFADFDPVPRIDFRLPYQFPVDISSVRGAYVGDNDQFHFIVFFDVYPAMLLTDPLVFYQQVNVFVSSDYNTLFGQIVGLSKIQFIALDNGKNQVLFTIHLVFSEPVFLGFKSYLSCITSLIVHRF